MCNSPETIDVSTGEVKASGRGILRTVAIASCIAVTAWDPESRVGALANVMLPGAAPVRPEVQELRYAANAISELLRLIDKGGGRCDRLVVCLVGAANVLKHADDRICAANRSSVAAVLKEHVLSVRASALGGEIRRSVALYTASGMVTCSEGSLPENVLWTPDSETNQTL